MRSFALSHNGCIPSNAYQIARFLRRPRLVGAALFTLVVFIALLPLMQLSRAMLIAFNAAAAVSCH